ncbi:MAG: hypothetical protein R2856_15990 [Caldilineaceae bacterium]
MAAYPPSPRCCIILEQQVSLASARATYERLTVLCSAVDPESFLAQDDDALRTIGFSRQKSALRLNWPPPSPRIASTCPRLQTLPDDDVRPTRRPARHRRVDGGDLSPYGIAPPTPGPPPIWASSWACSRSNNCRSAPPATKSTPSPKRGVPGSGDISALVQLLEGSTAGGNE